MLISLFEFLPVLIPIALLWHAGLILDKNVNTNINFSYPTIMYERFLAQMYFWYYLQFLLFTMKKILCINSNIIFLQEIRGGIKMFMHLCHKFLMT